MRRRHSNHPNALDLEVLAEISTMADEVVE
jgi:hypothetical protein